MFMGCLIARALFPSLVFFFRSSPFALSKEQYTRHTMVLECYTIYRMELVHLPDRQFPP
jgi:hypothetical protein